jgi:hypothetical protein
MRVLALIDLRVSFGDSGRCHDIVIECDTAGQRTLDLRFASM